MKNHGADMIGNLHLEELTTLPSWTAADERRLIYVADEELLYYGGSSDWEQVIVSNESQTLTNKTIDGANNTFSNINGSVLVDDSIPSAKIVSTDRAIPSGTKIWFYADSAPTGWTIDATPSDRILAVKGGSTYVTGGVQVGSWTVSGISTANESSHTHLVSGSTDIFNTGLDDQGSGSNTVTPSHVHTLSITSQAGSAHNHIVNQDGTWRPSANVGIICTKD